MNDFVSALVALMAALSAATSNPVDVDKIPDRPKIVQQAPASVPATNMLPSVPKTENKSSSPSKSSSLEINGTIQSIDGNTITVNGQTFTLDASTNVEGKLQVGALVLIEGTGANGKLVATEIQVKSDDGKSSITKSSDDKSDKQSSTVSEGKTSKEDSDKDQSDSVSSDDKTDDKNDDSSDDSNDDSSDDSSDDSNDDSNDDSSDDSNDDKSDDSEDDSSDDSKSSKH